MNSKWNVFRGKNKSTGLSVERMEGHSFIGEFEVLWSRQTGFICIYANQVGQLKYTYSPNLRPIIESFKLPPLRIKHVPAFEFLAYIVRLVQTNPVIISINLKRWSDFPKSEVELLHERVTMLEDRLRYLESARSF